MRPAIVILSASVVLGPALSPARAITIFSTGFEAPTYTTGPLDGQDGWFQPIGAASAFTVQTVTVNNGSRAVQINPAGQATEGIFHLDAYDTSQAGNPPGVTYSGAFDLATTGTANEFRFTAYNGLFKPLGAIVVLPGGDIDVDSGSGLTTTSASVGTGVWHTFDLQFDFATDDISAFLDGNIIASGLPFLSTQTPIFGAVQFQADPGGSGTQTMFVDDITVTASKVPEPATLSFLALGMAALMGLRRASRPAA